MKKILLTIEYNGKNFCGWQRQKNGRSVQEVLETKISKLLGETIVLYASGRTDSGVHALNQTAHFETESNFDIKKLPNAINAGLESDVCVKNAKYVSKNFHARYSVKEKTYLYKIYVSKIILPLKNGFATQVKTNLNLSLMQEACKYFVGTHNFYAFCSSGTSAKGFVRTIYKISVNKSKDEIHFKITGNGFLYNMVRIIVGTLIDVGLEKISPDNISNIIHSENRTLAGKTMPAEGLYLYNVKY